MSNASYFAYSPQPFGRIGRPRPLARCRYPGCEEQQDPDMVTCLQHSIAYRELRQAQQALQRKQEHATVSDSQAEDIAKVQCQREGCQRLFTPRRPGQMYHTATCGRIAERLRRIELQRVTRENKKHRAAEAQALGVKESDLLARKIDAFWERVKDPTYYQGVRHRSYSTLVMTAEITRPLAKSTTTGGAR